MALRCPVPAAGTASRLTNPLTADESWLKDEWIDITRLRLRCCKAHDGFDARYQIARADWLLDAGGRAQVLRGIAACDILGS